MSTKKSLRKKTLLTFASSSLAILSLFVSDISLLKHREEGSAVVSVSINESHAGIPTIDIAGLLQMLVTYINDLSAYAESLYQSSVATNEYVQTLAALEQTYREYEHTLNQIEGLADYIDEEGWREVFDSLDISFPLDPLDSYWDDWGVTVYTDDGVIEIDEIMEQAYDRMREMPQVIADIEAAIPAGPQRDRAILNAERHFSRSRDATEQAYSAEVYTQHSAAIKSQIETLSEIRRNNATGGESELRTLQTMALQNELQMNINSLQSDLFIKMLELSNQDSIERRNSNSYAYDRRLIDMREVQETENYEPDTSRTSSAGF